MFKQKLDKLKSQLTDLRKGISEVHEKSKKVGIFKCPRCQDKAFKTKEFLEKHIQRRHAEKYPEQEKLDETENIKESEIIPQKAPEINPLPPPPPPIDENKIIKEISDKLNSEISRIQFNLQLEFNQKLNFLEEQSKENAEFIRNTAYMNPLPIPDPTGERNDIALLEVIRLNENFMNSQNNHQMNMEKTREEMKSSMANTQKTLDDYAQKLKRLNKNMKKIEKENRNFQISFFKSLKEYQNEIKKKEPKKVKIEANFERKLEKTEESEQKQELEQEPETEEYYKTQHKPEEFFKTPSPLKSVHYESPQKICLNTHIGDLMSDYDSVLLIFIFG